MDKIKSKAYKDSVSNKCEIPTEAPDSIVYLAMYLIYKAFENKIISKEKAVKLSGIVEKNYNEINFYKKNVGNKIINKADEIYNQMKNGDLNIDFNSADNQGFSQAEWYAVGQVVDFYFMQEVKNESNNDCNV